MLKRLGRYYLDQIAGSLTHSLKTTLLTHLDSAIDDDAIAYCLLPLGRLPPREDAALAGYIRHPVKSQVFPGLIRSSRAAADDSSDPATGTTSGVVYYDIRPSEMRRLDWFEDKEYTRTDVRASLTNRNRKTNLDGSDGAAETDDDALLFATQTYVWTNPVDELDVSLGDWSYENFRERHLDWYLENTVRPCREELDRLRY